MVAILQKGPRKMNTMSRLRTWILVCMMACSMPAAVSASQPIADRGTASGAENAGANKIADLLVERGMTRPAAETVVAQLSANDIEVLAENPEMLQAAGDSGDVALAVLLVLLLVLLLAAAASA